MTLSLWDVGADGLLMMVHRMNKWRTAALRGKPRAARLPGREIVLHNRAGSGADNILET